jgi:uncharacterized protein
MTRGRPTTFAPPAAAATLFDGTVMHARMKPKTHRFTYKVYSLLVDVDRLDEADRLSRFFSIGRPNLLSFRPGDHGDGGKRPLGAHARSLLKEAGLSSPPARIMLMCYPRVLGFTFNPISIYFAYDEQDRLTGLIYEVRNTFGEMHTYVAPVIDGELTEAGVRQERNKLFYVSPFMDMPMRYRFRIRPPADDIAIRILETDADGPVLAATFIGARKGLTTWSALAAFVRVPLMTAKVVAGIHYEAMKLWFKGIRFVSRPAPPPSASAADRYLPPSSTITAPSR